MKKLIVGILLVALITAVYWVRNNPPIEANSIAYGGDFTSVLLEMGNAGMTDIRIAKVTINNEETPQEIKMQVNHPDQGFVIPADFSSPEVSEYNFVDLQDAKIQKGTVVSDVMGRLERNQVKKDDKIYALTILNDERIQHVEVRYYYLGMPYTIKTKVK